MPRNHKLYGVWAQMKWRCGPKGRPEYKGRGISVCLEWQDYSPFEAWALSNGYAEGLQIDRTDNDDDYMPTNCRFTTHTENQRNRTDTLHYDDVEAIRSDPRVQHKIAADFGIHQSTVSRIKTGRRWAPCPV